VLLGVAAFGVVAPRAARAEGPALDCPSSSEEGQRLRDKNRYLDAREMFRACSRPTCPGIVRKDCSKWLAELDDSQPSIVIAAQDAAGADIAAVKVEVDGRVIASKTDGSAIPVDPGEHTFTVEAAGHKPTTVRLVVRVNEKNRLVRVTFDDGPKAPAATKIEPPRPPAAESRGVPVLGLTLAGVGALAMGSFAYFGATSKSDLDGLRSTCAPFCEQAALDDVKSRMLVADVSLGIGIVALGVATVLIIAHYASHPAASPMTTATR